MDQVSGDESRDHDVGGSCEKGSGAFICRVSAFVSDVNIEDVECDG